jgi:1-acyl-sn-glycerol-3-phosphate acyltransferase
MPLFPRRYLRFMAKSELFWFPLGPFISACGAFPVHRGHQDQEAVDTALRLCREGNIVVMFPEGTRREKGLRKRHEARWRSGAARIALEAGVPLIPAGVYGSGRLLRFGRLRVAFGDPIVLDDLRGLPADEAARVATERLRSAITELEEALA